MTLRPKTDSGYRDVAREAAATALGNVHRDDPSLPGTGGPAGNAQLTAWVGLLLLPLFGAEMVTLLSLPQLLSCARHSRRYDPQRADRGPCGETPPDSPFVPSEPPDVTHQNPEIGRRRTRDTPEPPSDPGRFRHGGVLVW
jgi:hypothetical protein